MAENGFREWAAKVVVTNQIIVLDGGFATLLERYGLSLESSLWSAEAIKDNANLVERAHMDYLDTGCDIITASATYQASLSSFQQHFSLTKTESEALLKKCITVPLQTIKNWKGDRTIQLAISIGPYGATKHDGSEYTGIYKDKMTKDELKKFHWSRIELYLRFLQEEDAQNVVWLIETVPCIIEIEALLELLLLEKRCLPILVSVTGNGSRDGEIASGESVEALAVALNRILHEEKQIFPNCESLLCATGFNCCAPKQMKRLLEEMRNHFEFSDSILGMCHPNSGEVWENGAWKALDTFEELSAEEKDKYSIAHAVPLWYKAGCRIFGGCCRTYPEDIKLIAGYRASFP